MVTSPVYVLWRSPGAAATSSDTEEGNIKLDGIMPCNTSGTELSWGYVQGFTHTTEGIRQMRGEGGATQVKDAEICLVSGSGGFPYGSGNTCCILRR